MVFIGADFKDRFFPNVDPIGKTIGIDGRPFEVIGVAQPKGSVFGQSQDNFVAIPDQTYFKIYGSHRASATTSSPRDRDHLEEAQDEIRTLIRSYRHLRPQQDDTFSDSLLRHAGFRLGSADGRHRRRGRRHRQRLHGGGRRGDHEHHAGRRDGAHARNRRAQKRGREASGHPESVPGRIVHARRHAADSSGVTIAWLIAVTVRNFTPVPMDVPLNAVVLGVSLSAAVGLFFGIYPARRAARLDPIVALRAETS